MNKNYMWIASAFFMGWAVLNSILVLMNVKLSLLYMFVIPTLLTAIGWVYAEYRIRFKEE